MTSRRDEAAITLERARDLGFLGASPIPNQVEHALGYIRAWEGLSLSPTPPELVFDLGSGGGLPGLVLAAEWPAARLVLVESMHRRSEFLRDEGDRLAWPNLAVDGRRAEDVGRDSLARGQAQLVVARGFGPPAVTAECAAPLLAPAGLLIVSEPPEDRERWPEAGLAQLGLVPVGPFLELAHYMVMRLETPCPDRFPRRVGIPAKRPLW